MKITKPEKCSVEGEFCPYLISIKGNYKGTPKYRCCKVNPLYKSRIDAAIILRKIKKRAYPDCQWEKDRAARNLP